MFENSKCHPRPNQYNRRRAWSKNPPQKKRVLKLNFDISLILCCEKLPLCCMLCPLWHFESRIQSKADHFHEANDSLWTKNLFCTHFVDAWIVLQFVRCFGVHFGMRIPMAKKWIWFLDENGSISKHQMVLAIAFNNDSKIVQVMHTSDTFKYCAGNLPWLLVGTAVPINDDISGVTSACLISNRGTLTPLIGVSSLNCVQ